VVNTTFNYDGLGRVTRVTPPSAGYTQYQYSGNAVIVTDPAGKQRRSVKDALGRLVEVDEPGVPPASAGNSAFMQSDGNFVLYNPTSGARWSAGPRGGGAGPIEMQEDGTLVLSLLKWRGGVYTPFRARGPFPPQTCSIGHALNAPQNLT